MNSNYIHFCYFVFIPSFLWSLLLCIGLFSPQRIKKRFLCRQLIRFLYRAIDLFELLTRSSKISKLILIQRIVAWILKDRISSWNKIFPGPTSVLIQEHALLGEITLPIKALPILNYFTICSTFLGWQVWKCLKRIYYLQTKKTY